MKVKQIVGSHLEEGEVTLKPLAGAQSVQVDGKAIGTATTPQAASAIADLAKKGEFTAADGEQQTQEDGHHVGTGDDQSDDLINDVINPDWEHQRDNAPDIEEAIFGFGNKTPEEWAKTSPQMAQLLQFREKYKGTPYQQQIEQRIKALADRLDLDKGEPSDASGQPKAVVPPEQFNTKQLRENGQLADIRKLAGL